MTLTPKQRLAMLVDEDELPKKPQSPPPAPKPESEPEPESTPAGTASPYFYEDNESDDGISRGPKHNERRMNTELPERFKKLSTNESPPTPPSPSSMKTMTGASHGQSAPIVGTASPGTFCPIMAISKFPYKYIRHPTAKQNVASGFFDSGKFWDYHWDLYYVWPPSSASVKPLVLIPTAQVDSLVQKINKKLKGSCPSLAAVDREYGVCLDLGDPHPNLQPRYLGRSTSQADFKSLEQAIPGQPYRPPHEASPSTQPTEDAQTHFTRLLEYATEISRSGKTRKGQKIARLNDRLQKQQSSTKDFEQAERFFGLRAPASAAADGFGAGPSDPWQVSHFNFAPSEADRNPPPIHPLQPVLHPFDSSPVLIAIDIEAYEFAPNRITEIGISTLDTRDLTGVAPGWFGESWRPFLRSRHVRIMENAHLENSRWVTGCANDFRFGKSEMVSQADITKYVATFFRAPYSKAVDAQGEGGAGYEGEAGGDEDDEGSPGDDEEKRTIVLVGHGFDNEIRYLHGLGYNPLNLSTLHPTTPILDTQHLYRTLTSNRDPVSLGKILQALDITPWGLHNAGNDARYTLEALVGVVVGSATGRGGGVGEEVLMDDGGGEGGKGVVYNQRGDEWDGDEEGGVSLSREEKDEEERSRVRELRKEFPSFSVGVEW